VEVSDRKTEYESVVKVRCILGNLTGTENGSTTEAAGNITMCHSQTVEVGWLNITFNATPQPPCTSSPIPAPCSDDFVNEEYDSLPEHGKAQQCSPCSTTTTTMTSTEAQTTTTSMDAQTTTSTEAQTTVVSVTISGYGTPVLQNPVACGSGEVVASQSAAYSTTSNCEARDECRIEVSSDCKLRVWLRDRCESKRSRNSWSSYISSGSTSSGACVVAFAAGGDTTTTR